MDMRHMHWDKKWAVPTAAKWSSFKLYLGMLDRVWKVGPGGVGQGDFSGDFKDNGGHGLAER